MEVGDVQDGFWLMQLTSSSDRESVVYPERHLRSARGVAAKSQGMSGECEFEIARF